MRYLILALVCAPVTVIVGVAFEVLTRPRSLLIVQTPHRREEPPPAPAPPTDAQAPTPAA
jgi:hypothetical protein